MIINKIIIDVPADGKIAAFAALADELFAENMKLSLWLCTIVSVVANHLSLVYQLTSLTLMSWDDNYLIEAILIVYHWVESEMRQALGQLKLT